MRPEPPRFHKAYDPNQARDARGRWTAGGGDLTRAIARAIDAAIGGTGAINERYVLGYVRNVERIWEATGLDISGLVRVMDSSAVRHALKVHGDVSEELRGQIPISPADIARVPAIIASAHTIDFKAATRRKPASIAYTAKIGDHQLTYVEVIRATARQVAFKTMWKR